MSAVCAASLSLSLLPAAGAAPSPEAKPPAASYQFALGKLLAVEGSVNDALAAFEAAEKAAPQSPDTAYVLVEHAQLLDRMAQYQRNSPLRDDSLRKAGEKIAEARRLAPDNLDVLRAAGEICLDLGTIDPASMAVARDALEEVRKRDPHDAESFLTLGRIYLDQGQPAKAAEVLRELVNNVPEQRMAYALLVEALMRANKPDEAQKALQEIVGFDPSSLEARLTLADLQTRAGKNVAALETLRGAPEDMRDDPRLKRQLAWALYQNGDLDEALKALDAIPATGGKTAKGEKEGSDSTQGINLLRGLIYTAQGRNEDAIGLLSKIHDADPKDTGIALTLARVMERAGRRDDAARLLSNLAAALDKDGKAKEAQEVRLETAQLYVGAKQWDRAGEALQPLLAAAHPDQAPTGFLLGAAYERAGQRDKAVGEFRRVLKIDPDFHAALNYLGYTFAEAGVNLDEALKLVSRAVALDPDNGAFVDSLGWTYYRIGRPEQARGYLERAARLEPEDATLQEHLGDVYVALGQKERARQAYQRSLELGGDNADKVLRRLGGLGAASPHSYGRRQPRY